MDERDPGKGMRRARGDHMTSRQDLLRQKMNGSAVMQNELPRVAPETTCIPTETFIERVGPSRCLVIRKNSAKQAVRGKLSTVEPNGGTRQRSGWKKDPSNLQSESL